MPETKTQEEVALVFIVQSGKGDCEQQMSASIQDASSSCQDQEGFSSVKSYPPVNGSHTHWTCVIEFNTQENADAWLRSSAYEVFKNQLERVGELKEKLLTGSMFNLRSGDPENTPSPVRWKQCIVIVSMLLPLLLSIKNLWPHSWMMPPFYKTLAFASIAVPIMIYVGNPIVGKYTSFWLLSNSKLSRWKNIGFTIAYTAGALLFTRALVWIGVL